MTFGSIFEELAALLVLASVIGAVGALLRQPLVVSFIIAGLVAGPNGLGVVQTSDTIATFAELGVALLLFLVGLKLDWQLVRSLAGVALATGLGQVTFTSLIGFLICLALGMTPLTALYVAVALTFSSTIIIIKLLSDKREVDALHGRIAVGFLIVQDLVVVIAMMAVSALAIRGTGEGPGALPQALMAIVLLVAAGLFTRYAAERLLRALARAPDLLVSFAIGWAALLAALFDQIGFSKELGGLVAGVTFASTSLREAISSRLSVVRDFLLLFFFVSLGAQFDLSTIGEAWPEALLLSLFVLIGNPLIVLLIMGLMGYRKRTGFLAGLTVAQISEFSLIFMAMGVTLGHVEQKALGLVTLVGLATIALSTYMIVYSHQLYGWLERWLTPFDRLSRHPHPDAQERPIGGPACDVVIYGLGRFGSQIAWRLQEAGLSVLGLDSNPDVVDHHLSQGLRARFGDASDPDFPGVLPLSDAKWVVIALPDYSDSPGTGDPRPGLIRSLREHGFAGYVAVAAHTDTEGDRLARIPNIVVLRPFVDAARQACERIVDAMPGAVEAT